MAKQFPTTDHKAVAYAAMKELARILKSDGELPPGYQQDVSGKRCVVTIPQGTTVHRPEGGEDGAPIGKQYKAAMQNTYGYSVLYLLVERLERFCQHEVVLAELTAAICEIVENNADTTENTLRQRNPDLYEDFNQWRETLRERLGNREENTPRNVNRESSDMPNITILN